MSESESHSLGSIQLPTYIYIAIRDVYNIWDIYIRLAGGTEYRKKSALLKQHLHARQ